MPRDKDKDNAHTRGPRDRAGGRKERPAGARGGEKKFANRGFGGKREEGGRPHRGDRDARPYRKREDRGERPFRARDDRGERRDFREGRGERKDFREGRGERKDFRAGRRESNDFRGDRGERKEFRDDRGKRQDFRGERSERGERRPFREDRVERGERRPFREDRGERRPFQKDRAERGRFRDEAPRKRFDRRDEAGDAKPWREREDRPRDARRSAERGGEDRPRFSRDRDQRGGDDRPKFSRPRSERPRREDDEGGERFAKRPAFGGRGAYRERKDDFRDRKGGFEKRAPREETKPKKTGERIAKVLARAGLASRRDSEEWIVQGRVAVNGRVINSPALDVTSNDVITVDGKPLPERERTRLFMYHKPRGLMTTHADPEGRPTVFDNLPEGLPRLISVGRLDFNTEGLLLLTNDGGLARVLELPETGWLRRYRVRAHGEVTQAQLDELKNGVEVDGVKYGPIDATLERDQGANVWLVFAIREGKNREVRNVLAHLGLEVNRLIRISYGPFQLGEIEEGAVDEVKTRVLREQLGEKVIAQAGADFALPPPARGDDEGEERPAKKPFKPAGKSALIADRKGRRVLVQRTGSEEARARNEEEAHGYGPPRRPKRGYHGKRDFKPRDE
ncbi:pseudouridine synthase [Bradyrhizobium sp. Tv2a-2]|uniref:pseudouridine synthase n=1 Tax=Bradyrhizobium sp. Tv2a-2 TaxID=113395 RepID=UPI0003FFF079|nr:pseudouridine synthase [Bradyrhizobium sp. Tv2a-2]